MLRTLIITFFSVTLLCACSTKIRKEDKELVGDAKTSALEASIEAMQFADKAEKAAKRAEEAAKRAEQALAK